MTVADETPHDHTPNEDGRTPPRRRGRRGRWIAGGLLLLLLIIVAVGVYVGYLALKVKDDIEAARSQATQAREAILDGDVAKATAAATAADEKAESATSNSHNPVWTIAAAVPWLGSPLDSVREMTDAVNDLTSDVLKPTAELSEVINPDSLRNSDSGINVGALANAQAQLAPIADSAESINDNVRGIDSTWLGMVGDAKTELFEQTDETARFVRGTDTAARLLPPMLGAGGDRSYFLAFQTPSEARATGGLVGAFGIVNARGGEVTVEDIGTNAELRPPRTPSNFGPEFNQMFGFNKPYTDSRNSNISAHFPYAAQIWMNMWQQQSGRQLDGAIALDPIALSYILKGTGPISLPDGEKITAENVVPITLSTSYERFGGDNAARKAYLQEIARTAVTSLSSVRGDAGQILDGLGKAVHERRIMIYSSNPDEQKLLESTNLGHQVAETTSPYANVVVQNAAGNKIDYYLKREIIYTAGNCDADTRESTVKVQLTNTVEDMTLPPYVIGHLGNAQNVENGTNIAVVQIDGTAGATLNSVLVDGQSNFFSSGTELGHPVSFSQVMIPPGKTVTVEFQFTEPTSATGPAVVPVQPLVDDPVVRVDVPECG